MLKNYFKNTDLTITRESYLLFRRNYICILYRAIFFVEFYLLYTYKVPFSPVPLCISLRVIRLFNLVCLLFATSPLRGSFLAAYKIQRIFETTSGNFTC